MIKHCNNMQELFTALALYFVPLVFPGPQGSWLRGLPSMLSFGFTSAEFSLRRWRARSPHMDGRLPQKLLVPATLTAWFHRQESFQRSASFGRTWQLCVNVCRTQDSSVGKHIFLRSFGRMDMHGPLFVSAGMWRQSETPLEL